jgi:hypothetical protein
MQYNKHLVYTQKQLGEQMPMPLRYRQIINPKLENRFNKKLTNNKADIIAK